MSTVRDLVGGTVWVTDEIIWTNPEDFSRNNGIDREVFDHLPYTPDRAPGREPWGYDEEHDCFWPVELL